MRTKNEYLNLALLTFIASELINNEILSIIFTIQSVIFGGLYLIELFFKEEK
jgi:hypothetical protein